LREPKYSNVKIKLVGLPADKLVIVDRTTLALRKAKVSEREIDLYQAEALAGNLDNCLAVTLETVDCFDDCLPHRHVPIAPVFLSQLVEVIAAPFGKAF
jgi:hypothetical protein